MYMILNWTCGGDGSSPSGTGISMVNSAPVRSGRLPARWSRPWPRRSRGRWRAPAQCRPGGDRCHGPGRICRRLARHPLAGCPPPHPAPAGSPDRPRGCREARPSSRPGAYLAALSSKLKSTCSKSTKSSTQHGQVRGQVYRRSCARPGSTPPVSRRCRRPPRDRPRRGPGRPPPIPAGSYREDWR